MSASGFERDERIGRNSMEIWNQFTPGFLRSEVLTHNSLKMCRVT